MGDYSKPTGFLLTQKLLGLPKPPTAIFAANDQSAYGALEAAHAAGLRIPDDLSVIGFDNIPESAYSAPPLTTVDQSIEAMGYLATKFLIQLITEGELENHTYTTPTRLVVRESCTKNNITPYCEWQKGKEVVDLQRKEESNPNYRAIEL
jgi:LacI family transcriptional regulator